MTTRTSAKTVTFRKPFVLGGYREVLPAGPYTVETEEKLMEGGGFPIYQRISTLIHLHANAGVPGLTQALTIDPKELDAAILRDQASGGRWSINMTDKSAKAAALLFQAQEKRRATSDYVRLREAEQEKTTRLRALRRARDAAVRAAADQAAAAKTATTKPRPKTLGKTKAARTSALGSTQA